jgi:hypothetical protein
MHMHALACYISRSLFHAVDLDEFVKILDQAKAEACAQEKYLRNFFSFENIIGYVELIIHPFLFST